MNTLKKPFFVLEECNAKMSNLTTSHLANERENRVNFVNENIEDGKYITSFIVDTLHPNGNEIHHIFDNGVIKIENEETRKFITLLIARPQQLYRYWNGLNKAFPQRYQYVIDKAREHQEKGFNNR